MLNRFSVNALLKTIIVVMSAMVVLTLAARAWDAYQRFTIAGEVEGLTKASNFVFRALNGARLDRSFTERLLKEEQPSVQDRKQITDAREIENPALQSTIAALGGLNFNQRQSFLEQLQRL